MDSLLITKVVTLLILPPGVLVLLLLVALAMWRSLPRAAGVLTLVVVLALYLVSVPYTGTRLANLIERHRAVTPAELAEGDVQAIVVLGGGRRLYAPELGSPTVSEHALERLRYGALLQRASGLPLAVTGGASVASGPAEGDLMAQSLARDFGARVLWIERHSRNTEENARLTRAMLAADGIERIALVSHASHLYRAVEMFRDQGFTVVPAPTGFLGDPTVDTVSLGDFLPSVAGMVITRLVVHEWLGRVWYRLRRQPGSLFFT